MPAKADKIRLNLSKEDDAAWLDALHGQITQNGLATGADQPRFIEFDLDAFGFERIALTHWSHESGESIYEAPLKGAKLHGTVRHINTVDLMLDLADGISLQVGSSTGASFYKLRFFAPKELFASLA